MSYSANNNWLIGPPMAVIHGSRRTLAEIIQTALDLNKCPYCEHQGGSQGDIRRHVWFQHDIVPGGLPGMANTIQQVQDEKLTGQFYHRPTDTFRYFFEGEEVGKTTSAAAYANYRADKQLLDQIQKWAVLTK